ncbi:MAG: 6-bladed beta-propeller [Gemmatimonadota bacterium]
MLRVAAFNLVLIPLLGGRAVAQEVHHIPDEPSCTDCSIALSTVMRLGATDGPGMLDWRGGQSFPAFDSRGRIYLRGFFTKELKVYDAGGNYEATIGGEGDGPGEFKGIMGIAIGSFDSLYVFDRLAMRLSVFSPDHVFARSARLEIEPSGYDPVLFPWDPDHFYMTAHMRTPDLIGWPIHKIDMAGSRVHSFGSSTGEYSPVDSFGGTRIIANGGNGTLWSGRLEEYVIERISPNSRVPLEVVRREAEWFPEPEYTDTEHGTRKPPPLVTSIFQDGDRLWVLTWVPDPKWSDAGPGLEDKYKRYDSVIEVIDIREDRVIARSRFDALYHQFLGPGLIGGTIFEGGLIPVYHIMRMEIRGLGN